MYLHRVLVAVMLLCAMVFSAPLAAAQDNLPSCPLDTNQTYDNCQGTWRFDNGEIYVGEFQAGQLHGYGKYTFRDGATYEGQFVAGIYDGQGTHRYANGDVYVGGFLKGARSGFGTFTYATGDSYTGLHDNNAFEGQGTMVFALGHNYVGGFSNSKRNGFGTFTFADGQRYEGNFLDDNFHGQGKFFAADGNVSQSGIYENNILVKPDAPTAQALLSPDADVAPLEDLMKKAEDPIAVDPQQQPVVRKNLVALVIGNGAYEHAPILANPANDANAMTKMLTQSGFNVISGADLNKQALERKVREFVETAQQADLALFFYAGHGIQVAGQNYLVPTDATVSSPTAIDFELINVATVTNHMGGENRVGVVLLDACRDNPFTRSLARSLGSSRSSQIGTGLAAVSNIGGGLLVGFATAPGDVASDGEGAHNSPFTTALLKHFPTKGLEIQQIMTRVKRDVIGQTKNQQRPWHNSDLAEEVYLSAQ